MDERRERGRQSEGAGGRVLVRVHVVCTLRRGKEGACRAVVVDWSECQRE